MSLILPFLLSIPLFAAIAAIVLLRRERNKSRLIRSLVGLRSDAPDGIGVSALCHDVQTPEQVERLLATEYSCYEVILTIDPHLSTSLFHTLVTRYRMIEVELKSAQHSQGAELRGVWRSRSRCFRRLVIVDCRTAERSAALDCAARVASYDFLMPLSASWQLRDGALERLVAEVASSRTGEVAEVSSFPGARLTIIDGDMLRSCGGFRRRAWQCIPRNRRRRVWQVLATDGRRRKHLAVWFVLALYAGIVIFLLAGRGDTAILVATAGVGWLAALYLAYIYVNGVGYFSHESELR